MEIADDRLECGEEDMLDCRVVIEYLITARLEVERAKWDLDFAVVDLRELSPSANINLEKL